MMTSNPILFMVLVVLCSIISFTIIETIFNNIKEAMVNKHKADAIEEKKNENVEKTNVIKTPNVSYVELLGILDSTIEKELYFAVKLKFDLQDVKIIDFNENLASISSHIMEALSQSYLDDLSYYHNKKWVMEYVVRKVRIYLTDYIRKHPVI